MTKINYLATKEPEEIDNIIIFVHGFGANARDLLSLAPYFTKEFSNLHAIAPNAPYETGMMAESCLLYTSDAADES